MFSTLFNSRHLDLKFNRSSAQIYIIKNENLVDLLRHVFENCIFNSSKGSNQAETEAIGGGKSFVKFDCCLPSSQFKTGP